MSFNISTHHFPSYTNFVSYEKAVEFYNSIKPKRDGTVPLATHRKGPYEIVLNTWSQSIQLVYHSTSVVTITPENKMLIDLSWSSTSTRLFADALVPYGVGISAHKGSNVIRVGDKAYITSKATIDLKEVKLIEGATTVEVRSINTSRTKQPRAILCAIEKFMSAAVALTPDYLKTLYATCPSNIYRQDYGDHLRDIDPADPETFLPVVQAMIRHQHLTNLPKLIAFMRQELYDAFEVYDWAQLPDGTLPANHQTYRVKEN
jgi:hypothetical protein